MRPWVILRQRTRHALVVLCSVIQYFVNVFQSCLSGFSFGCIHKLFPLNRIVHTSCPSTFNRNQFDSLNCQHTICHRQYDRLSQQQLSFLLLILFVTIQFGVMTLWPWHFAWGSLLWSIYMNTDTKNYEVFCHIKCCEACVACNACIQDLIPEVNTLLWLFKKCNISCPRYLEEWTLYGAAFIPPTSTILVSMWYVNMYPCM